MIGLATGWGAFQYWNGADATSLSSLFSLGELSGSFDCTSTSAVDMDALDDFNGLFFPNPS